MSQEKVREYFKLYGLEKRITELDTSSATVGLAAKALGCEEAKIAKTLAFKVYDSVILIVAAGDAKVDNAKYKEKFGIKASMADKETLEKIVGHAAGGVCPFCVNDGIKVYLDESLKRFEVVYPAAGSSSNTVELSIKELAQYSNYVEWIDVCKNW